MFADYQDGGIKGHVLFYIRTLVKMEKARRSPTGQQRAFLIRIELGTATGARRGTIGKATHSLVEGEKSGCSNTQYQVSLASNHRFDPRRIEVQGGL